MSVRQGVNTIAGSGYTKSEVDTLLAGKANTALSNITATGKEVIAHNAMPSNSYISLTLGSSGATYTAPADGWFMGQKQSTGAGEFIQMENQTASSLRELRIATGGGQNILCSIQASKSDTVKISYSLSGGNSSLSFIYANGAK